MALADILDTYLQGLGVQQWGPDWRQKMAQARAQTDLTQAQVGRTQAETTQVGAQTELARTGAEENRVQIEAARDELAQVKVKRAKAEELVKRGLLPERFLVDAKAEEFTMEQKLKDAELSLRGEQVKGTKAQAARDYAAAAESRARAGMYGQLTAAGAGDEEQKLVDSYASLSRQRGQLQVPPADLRKRFPQLAGRIAEAVATPGTAGLDKKAGESASALGLVNVIRGSLKGGETTGPMTSLGYWLKANVPGIPEPRSSQATLATAMAVLKNRVIKDITGAQMSEYEVPRLTQELPQLGDKPGVRDAKLNLLEARLQVVSQVQQGLLSKEAGIAKIESMGLGVRSQPTGDRMPAAGTRVIDGTKLTPEQLQQLFNPEGR